MPTQKPALPPAAALCATPQGVLKLVQLFAENEESLRFPDVDSQSLAQGLSLVEQLRTRAAEMGSALAEAILELEAAEVGLLERARRGHAYASIYATEAPEIMSTLAEIKLGAPQRAPRKRRVMLKSGPEAGTSSGAATSSEAGVPRDAGGEAPSSGQRVVRGEKPQGQAPIAAE